MTRYKSMFAGLAALVAGLALTTGLHGSEASLRTSYLSFSGPVALPGVTLPAGTYIFERVDATAPDIVAVRSQDRSQVYFVGFTARVIRPSWLELGRTAATLRESQPGTVPPIDAWYPLDTSIGHRFMYR